MPGGVHHLSSGQPFRLQRARGVAVVHAAADRSGLVRLASFRESCSRACVGLVYKSRAKELSTAPFAHSLWFKSPPTLAVLSPAQLSSSGAQMVETSTDAGDSSEEVLLASVQGELICNLRAEGLPPSSGMPYERTNSSTSEQWIEWSYEMAEGSIDAVASSKEVIAASVQDGTDSKLAADDSLPSSNMAPEPRDLASISKALDTMSLVRPTSDKVKLKTILDAVNKGGMMDTDTLNLAIRNMAREKSSDGGMKNSKPSCRKHCITADFAMGAIYHKRDNFDVSDVDVDPVYNMDFKCLNALESDNIDVLCIPVIHVGHWTLYAYDMKNGELSILDSMEDHSRHEGIPFKIGKALERVQTDYGLFKNKSNFSCWPHVFPQVPQQGYGTNDCGFFVFKFMCHWNGHELGGLISWETMELRKEFLAYIHALDIDESDLEVHYSGLEETLELKQEFSESGELSLDHIFNHTWKYIFV